MTEATYIKYEALHNCKKWGVILANATVVTFMFYGVFAWWYPFNVETFCCKNCQKLSCDKGLYLLQKQMCLTCITLV